MKTKQTFVFKHIAGSYKCEFVNGINTDKCFYLDEMFPCVYSALVTMCSDNVFVNFKGAQSISGYFDKYGNIIVRSICFI